jgi:uncharacterized protein (TIGR02996 family)
VSDLDCLLRAVCADPADDLPRWAYADALEERGTPDELNRALFVRTQIAMHAVPEAIRLPAVLSPEGKVLAWDEVPNPQWQALAALIGPLLGAQLLWERLWFDSLGPRLPGTRPAVKHFVRRYSCAWSRGFISAAQFRADDWPDLGPPAVRSQPIERLDLLGLLPLSHACPPDYPRVGHQGYVYFWEFSRSALGRSSTLPIAWRPFFPRGLHEFASQEDALAAAGAAALGWARHAARLPALVPAAVAEEDAA